MADHSGQDSSDKARVIAALVLGAICLGGVAAPTMRSILDQLYPAPQPGYPVRLSMPMVSTPVTASPGFSVPLTAGATDEAPSAEPSNAAGENAVSQQAASNFAREFAFLDSSGKASPVASRKAMPLAIDYDLVASSRKATVGEDGSTIEIDKRLRINGTDAGAVRLRIGDGTQVWIASGDLVRAAGQANSTLAQVADRLKDKPFVSFNALRAGGITVRYDPAVDRVDIAT